MTLPRIAGSALSCSVEFPVDMNAMLVAPAHASAISSSASVGAALASAIATPNAHAARVRGRSPVLPRAATSSPPPTAPIPIAAVMKP
jgi:hypothetical protein